MEMIYLDEDQCNRYSVQYYSQGDQRLSVSASELLASKSNGYDQQHQDYLGTFGDVCITLVNTVDDAPGWFRVVG